MKVLKILFLAASLIGFLDATYLTIKHFQGEPPVCGILKGCEIVATSKYAIILGIPVALIGAIYYFTVLVSAIIYLDTKRKIFIKFAILLSLMGFLASLWFLYLQIFVIKQLCIYCLISAGTSTILAATGTAIILLLRKSAQIISQSPPAQPNS